MAARHRPQQPSGHSHVQRRPVTKERRQCPRCRTLITDAAPAGWVLHLLCREHSSVLVQNWDQASPRASHLSQLSPKPGSRHFTREDLDAAEEWARRGFAMGLTPQEFETLQLLLRRAFDAVGRTTWRRTFISTERKLFTQSLPDLAMWSAPARGATTELTPKSGSELVCEEKMLSFVSFAALVRGKMSLSACPDEMLVRMWLLLDVAPPRGQVSWTELTHVVRQCPLYKAEPAQPRIPHSDALPMPPWLAGQRVYVPRCGIGTVIGLGRMAGDIRVSIDPTDGAAQKTVWRRREDIARIVTEPDQAVQGLMSPAAQALRLLLRQSHDDYRGPLEQSRAKGKSLPRHRAGAGSTSMWASSPLNLQSSMASNRHHHTASNTKDGLNRQPRKADRVREHVVKNGASSAAAERLVREQDAAALKLYRASRLYGLIGDVEADEGCSPRTWWFNERQRRAAAQKKADADRIKKAEAAAAAALAEADLSAGSFKSPYASTTTIRAAASGRQKRLRGGGRVLLPPSRGRSPPVVEPRLSHLIPKGPLVWDPVRGFDDSESLQYPLVDIVSCDSTSSVSH